jgi:tetratricopeptide (TPR) repeat protein
MAAEGILRMAGYGFCPQVVVPMKVEEQRCLVSNDGFSRLFFPTALAREFDPFVFPSVKAAGTVRIVVLGESAAQGTPDGAYSFSRILSRMLESSYQDLVFEVINTGMTAINSHAILPIAEALSRYNPDAFVVYMGNNEVVGPYGAGTVFSDWTPHGGLIRAGLALRGYRLGQWLSGVLSRPAPELLRGWGGMQMFVDHQVSADDPRLEGVYKLFQANLADICQVATRAGAQVLLCTVGSNLRDCPPFASAHNAGLTEEQLAEWKRQFDAGVGLEQKGQLAEATAAYQAAWAIDDRYAETAFRLGRCSERQKEYAAAGSWYRQARQLDTLRFRADDRINGIIREQAAGGANVSLVDTAGVLEQASPNGLTGREMFYEHVHLTFAGNTVVARAIFEELGNRLAILKDKQTGPVPGEAQCAESLAFTEVNRVLNDETVLDVYLTQSPFTNQPYHAEWIAEWKQKVEAGKKTFTPERNVEVRAIYERQILLRPKDAWLRWKYAELLDRQFRDEQAARSQLEQVLRLVPQNRVARNQLAVFLEKAGHPDEARKQYQTILEYHPGHPEGLFGMGYACSVEKHLEDAVVWYRRCLKADPSHLAANTNLADVLVRLNRTDEAIAVCRQALEFCPNDVSIHFNLGLLLYRQNQLDEARAILEKAAALDPQAKDIRDLLAAVRKRQSR